MPRKVCGNGKALFVRNDRRQSIGQPLQDTLGSILWEWRLPVARQPLGSVRTSILLLDDGALNQMYGCLAQMVSEEAEDSEMQETSRRLEDGVKVQVNHLQKRVTAKAHSVGG